MFDDIKKEIKEYNEVLEMVKDFPTKDKEFFLKKIQKRLSNVDSEDTPMRDTEEPIMDYSQGLSGTQRDVLDELPVLTQKEAVEKAIDFANEYKCASKSKKKMLGYNAPTYHGLHLRTGRHISSIRTAIQGHDSSDKKPSLRELGLVDYVEMPLGRGNVTQYHYRRL